MSKSRLPLLLFIAGIAALFILPEFMKNDPLLVSLARRLQSPSGEHWLGTDGLGRDALSRLVYGGRNTVGASLLILILSLSIGIPAGVIAGVMGKGIDRLFMRVSDSFLAFPDYLIAIVLTGLLGPGIVNLMIAIVFVKWVAYARLVRSSLMAEKEKEYIYSARLSGVPTFRLVLRHLLPAAFREIVVVATLDMGKIILMIAALSYIGLGLQPPAPEWGAMLNEGRAYFHSSPLAMVIPGVAIMLFVLLSNLIGDQLRNSLDLRPWGK
ncbi:nickel ABC transporter permease subunit NikC [Paenibacillus kribbensis]|uniref:Nickel ABC transporter permease subunit NikC n=1 Tax=Paenibacillus kribbensis TaxID=172713 RepID=A0A222WJD2_9BACL|nr:nickel transporter permease [Paenibacillus kribbensis]ASR45903.1 nickel ABC transporter permease subunit NikC [Paenibacillus kribbensis]